MSEINNNGLDLSPERVEKEWLRIEQEFNLIDTQKEPETTEQETGEGETKTGVLILSAEEYERKKTVTKNLINSGLNAALWMLGAGEIPENLKDDFCDSWADVIVQRFPDNPVTDFMDAYGDLIAAGSATLILIGAVRKQKQISRNEAKTAVKESMNNVVATHGEAA